MLCTIEAATVRTAAGSPDDTPELDAAESAVLDRPVLHAMVLDARARLARAAGDLDGAASLLRRGLAPRRLPDRLRHALLLSLGEVLVDQGAWDRLEAPAADVVAGAVRTGDPVLLAHGQRLLGLAYLGTGRPVEAAELLAAALPVLGRHAPALVGHDPVGARRGPRGRGAVGRTPTPRSPRHPRSSRPRSARRRPPTASGRRAPSRGMPVTSRTAASHLDAAVARRARRGAVELFVEALRSRAGLRVDARRPGRRPRRARPRHRGGRAARRRAGRRRRGVRRRGARAARAAPGRPPARGHGHVDAAVERLGRAEALVGAGLELVLRAEAAARARRPRPARGGRAAAAGVAARAAAPRDWSTSGSTPQGRSPEPSSGPAASRRPRRSGSATAPAAESGADEALARASPRPGRAPPAPAPWCRARGSSPPGRRGCRSRR